MTLKLSSKNKTAFREGIKDGIPIGLGYLAVSFSLGILASKSGFTPLQCLVASLLNNASAGEYVLFTLAGAGATYLEVAIMTFVANARYLLMSTAFSQRIAPNEKNIHRLILGFDLTDEFFGIAISREGFINPFYSYGAMSFAAPCWAIGTALGCIAKEVMPLQIVSALSVALYGMFIAIIMPPAKRDAVIRVAILISFILSFITSRFPIIKGISDGTRIIALTVIISAVLAFFFPHDPELKEEA